MTLVEFFEPLGTIFGFIGNIWWVWLPVVLFFIASGSWLDYRRKEYLLGAGKWEGEWVLLEIHSPREIEKSAKAMDQVFASLYSVRNFAGNFFEKWWDGEVSLWFSFEIASLGGQIHFYIRTPSQYQRIVEAFLHAQYPDVEIVKVDDYIHVMPEKFDDLAKVNYRLWGSELVLVKDDAYPIRTYVEFESQTDEQNLDPVAALVELLGKLKPSEHLWLQILIRPADTVLHEKGKKLVKELREKQKVTRVGAEGEEYEYFAVGTPGETEMMKSIERSVSKLAFHTLIRYIFMAPEDIYSSSVPRRGIVGVFNQYASEAMNKFRHNYFVATQVQWHYYPYLFPKARLAERRKTLYKHFRERKFPDEGFYTRLLNVSPANLMSFNTSTILLTTEELATIFHLPSNLVITAPMMKKVQSRRVGPPAGLDIFKEDEPAPPAYPG